MPYVVASFYHFFPFEDFRAWQTPLLEYMKAQGMRGTILLAPEGINATVAGTRAAVDGLIAKLPPRVEGMEYKEDECDTLPFRRAKVRLKKEIITFGEAVDFARAQSTHVESAQWNALIADSDTLVVDARNAYEVEHGTFQGAINPGIRTFTQLKGYVARQLDPAQHKKIATFCTGGIRCEKFASYLKQQGFEEVYQLKGGILRYLKEMPDSESLWQGECFVFDERVSVSSPPT